MAPRLVLPALASLGLLACGSSPAPEPATPSPATSAATAPSAASTPSVPHVKGNLSPDDVQRIVRIRLYEVQACYEKGLDKNPQLAGKLVYKFVIGPDGKVASIENQGSTVLDSEVIACGQAVFAALQFKPPEGGGTVTVTYPVDLKKRGPAPAP